MKRTAKRAILYTAATLCFLAGLALIFVFTSIRFTGLLLCLAAPILALWALLDKGSERHRIFAAAKFTLSILLVLGFLLFGFLETEVIRWSNTDHETAVSGVIILGAGVNGSEPSLSLRVRLEAALRYIADKPEIPIVVTGSQGPGEEISEAQCMADWLIAHGVDESRILIEDQADNTRENIAFSKALLSENGYDPLDHYAVVSSDYHLCRAAVYWELPYMVGVAAKMPEPYQHSFLTVNYYIREAFGLAAEFPSFMRFYWNTYIFPQFQRF